MRLSSHRRSGVLVSAASVGVLMSILLLSCGRGTDTGDQLATGEKSAISTATPVPTLTPTPVPTGTVIKVVHRCSLYFYDGPHWVVQDPSDVNPDSVCIPPYPEALSVYSDSGVVLFDIQGLQATITKEQDSGAVFEVSRGGVVVIAVGDHWPSD